MFRINVDELDYDWLMAFHQRKWGQRLTSEANADHPFSFTREWRLDSL